MDRAAPLRRILASRAVALLATALLTAVGVVLVTWPLIRVMGRATLRDGEVLLTAWQLNWFHHALLTDPASWIDANIFFPYDHATTFNDLLLSHAILTLPVAAAESPVLALNLALLGGIVLSGLFAYLLLDELVDAPWAAAAGGILFALAPFRFLHMGHLSVAAAWAVPMFFWALVRHLRQPSWAWAALAAASGVAVGLSSIYQAAFAAPIAPLVLIVGARRGPGGRRVWLPLLAMGVPAVALVAWLLAPYAEALRTFGVASAPDDLIRYGADLTSLGQRPEVLAQGGAVRGIDAEAHLYPGAALVCLAGLGALGALLSVRTLRAWRRNVAFAGLALGGVCALGLVLPLDGPLRDVWQLAVLALIWAGPVAVAAWAIAATNTADATGPSVGIRLGLAGATLAFVLALGPQARYLARAIGPAPYWLLARASAAFEGTRVPARFGGLVILFLAIVAAGALAALMRANARRWRIAGATATASALLVCFVELPVPALPKGHELVDLPALQDPVYRWLAQQPGRLGILELPDWSADADVEYLAPRMALPALHAGLQAARPASGERHRPHRAVPVVSVPLGRTLERRLLRLHHGLFPRGLRADPPSGPARRRPRGRVVQACAGHGWMAAVDALARGASLYDRPFLRTGGNGRPPVPAPTSRPPSRREVLRTPCRRGRGGERRRRPDGADPRVAPRR